MVLGFGWLAGWLVLGLGYCDLVLGVFWLLLVWDLVDFISVVMVCVYLAWCGFRRFGIIRCGGVLVWVWVGLVCF